MDFSQSSQYQTYVPESISYREDVIPSHALSENEQTGGVHGFNVPTEFVPFKLVKTPLYETEQYMQFQVVAQPPGMTMLTNCEKPNLKMFEVQRPSSTIGPPQPYTTYIERQKIYDSDTNFSTSHGYEDTFSSPFQQNTFTNAFQIDVQGELLTTLGPLGDERCSTPRQEQKDDNRNYTHAPGGRPAKNTEKRFQCLHNACTQKFTSKYRLATHENRFHRPANHQEKFICDACNIYSTPYFSALSRHRKGCVKTSRQ